MTSAQRVGSLFITDHPTDPIEIDCRKCGRNGRYRKATLIEKYGSDTVLTGTLRRLNAHRPKLMKSLFEVYGALTVRQRFPPRFHSKIT